MEGLHHWLRTIHRTERFSAAPRRIGEETVGASGRVRQVDLKRPLRKNENFPPGARLEDPIPLFLGCQARYAKGRREVTTYCCSLSSASALGKQGAAGKPLCSPEKPRFITSLRKQDRSCQGFAVACATQERTICAGRRALERRRCRLAPSYPALSNLPYSGVVSCRATFQIVH